MMRKHRPNHRRVKTHRNYTIEEIASLSAIRNIRSAPGSRLDYQPAMTSARG